MGHCGSIRAGNEVYLNKLKMGLDAQELYCQDDFGIDASWYPHVVQMPMYYSEAKKAVASHGKLE